MGEMQLNLNPEDLIPVIGTPACPRIVDVRRAETFAAATEAIPAARWHDHRDAEAWSQAPGVGEEIVVYCVHGHQVSQSAAALLRSQGVSVRCLAGGIEAYREAGGTLVRTSPGLQDRTGGNSHWVGAAGVDLDGLARVWFIRRFLDPAAVLHFVEADWVDEVAAELGGRPIGPAAAGGEEGCRLHDFFLRYSLGNDALDGVAKIVETADPDRERPGDHGVGLAAMIAGLTEIFEDDGARVSAALPVFDALYAGCRQRALDSAASERS